MLHILTVYAVGAIVTRIALGIGYPVRTNAPDRAALVWPLVWAAIAVAAYECLRVRLWNRVGRALVGAFKRLHDAGNACGRAAVWCAHKRDQAREDAGVETPAQQENAE